MTAAAEDRGPRRLPAVASAEPDPGMRKAWPLPDPWDDVFEAAFTAWIGNRPAPALPPAARGFVAGWLAERERRVEVLAGLRRRFAAPPFQWIHPSWVIALLPTHRVLRTLLLEALPETVRPAVLETLRGESVPVEARAALRVPDWLRAWWLAELQTRLAYPRPLPGDARSRSPLTQLHRLPTGQLEATLGRLGRRALARLLPILPRHRAARWVFDLPADDLVALDAMSRDAEPAREGPRPSRRRLEALFEDRSLRQPLLVRLGAVDLAAQAGPLEHPAAAVRAAYALPRPLGRVMLGFLEQPDPGWVDPDPAAWQGLLSRSLLEVTHGPSDAESPDASKAGISSPRISETAAASIAPEDMEPTRLEVAA
ncbi:MAG: hypothetical protein AAGC60_01670 [Acidobacteriota bacterium]